MLSSVTVADPISRRKRFMMLGIGMCCILLSGPIAALPGHFLQKFLYGGGTIYIGIERLIGWPLIVLGLALISVGIRRKRSESPRKEDFRGRVEEYVFEKMISELRLFPIVTLAAGLLVLSFFVIRGAWFPPVDEVVFAEIRNAAEQEHPKLGASGINVEEPASPYWESFDHLFGLPLRGPVYDRSELSVNELRAEFPLASPRRTFAYQHHSWGSISADIVRGQETIRIVVNLIRCRNCDSSVFTIVAERSNLSKCEEAAGSNVRCYERSRTFSMKKRGVKVIFDFAKLP